MMIDEICFTVLQETSDISTLLKARAINVSWKNIATQSIDKWKVMIFNSNFIIENIPSAFLESELSLIKYATWACYDKKMIDDILIQFNSQDPSKRVAKYLQITPDLWKGEKINFRLLNEFVNGRNADHWLACNFDNQDKFVSRCLGSSLSLETIKCLFHLMFSVTTEECKGKYWVGDAGLVFANRFHLIHFPSRFKVY